MRATVFAICSNPDCTGQAVAPGLLELPGRCPTCSAPMLDRCWKCDQPLGDPLLHYCARCGVPLKRVLPGFRAGEPLLAICSNPGCGGAVSTTTTAALPSRCPRCGARLISDCWKCGARVVEADQEYCRACGVPLKRLRSAT